MPARPQYVKRVTETSFRPGGSKKGRTHAHQFGILRPCAHVFEEVTHAVRALRYQRETLANHLLLPLHGLRRRHGEDPAGDGGGQGSALSARKAGTKRRGRACTRMWRPCGRKQHSAAFSQRGPQASPVPRKPPQPESAPADRYDCARTAVLRRAEEDAGGADAQCGGLGAPPGARRT